MRTLSIGPLTCRVLGAVEGVKPNAAVVLCHGFGAGGDDLVPLGRELLRQHPTWLGTTWLVFPEAPLTLEQLGMPGARAWWYLDMERINAAMNHGRMLELSQEEPDGMAAARKLLTRTLNSLLATTGLPMQQVVVGGFSQGAMLATDTVLRLEEAPAALAIMSGTLVAQTVWRPRAERRRTMPTLIAHGTQDSVLPFFGAEALRDCFTEAGWQHIDFAPFDDGHTIAPVALAWLAKQVQRLHGDGA
ncbi:MAG: phospholipase/carboxylesterase [Myxococcota bacterium]|jgi:phospholipase/carboxylesterase